MRPQNAIRKNPKHITIAHISDLHFSRTTNFPPDSRNVQLEELIKSLKLQQPDLLCVTGDIADNTWSETLKGWNSQPVGDQQALEGWNQHLRSTFQQSLDFLKHACNELAIDPNYGLFAIPGNHDCRIQGIYSGLLSRVSGKRGFKAESSDFLETFGPFFENRSITLSHPNDPVAIILKIICLNSNDKDVVLNFATGAVSAEEIQKLSLLKNTLTEENGLTNATQFRACLVHHHPLPIASAEALRETSSDGSGRIKNILSVVMGEQTNMFKNGGSFLFGCLDNEIDIVMHGHQHHSWFSNIQYPAKSTRRLLVSGAGSAGKETDSRYSYCVYRLEVNGNIEVEELTTLRSPVKYEKTVEFFVYDYGEIRQSRRHKLIEQLKNEKLPDADCKYGVATAEEYVRTTKIGMDGNASTVRLYRKLKSTGPPIRSVPINAASGEGFVGHAVPPKISIIENPDNYYTSLKWQVAPSSDSASNHRGLSGQLVFEPELDDEHLISVRVEYVLCNAFEFVQEYRRANTLPEMDELENYTTALKAIYVNLFNEVIIFPPELSLSKPPLVHATGPGLKGEVDQAETRYCQDFLNAPLESGIISLSIKYPLPNFKYKVSWHLLSEVEYNKKIFDPDGVSEYQKLMRGLPPKPKVTDSLHKILQELRDSFSSPLEGETKSWLDETTEVSLLIPVQNICGYGCQQTIDVMLHRMAQITPSGQAGSTGNKAFRPGVGIGGQAFRSRKPILFDSENGQSTNFYVKFAGQKKVHSVLLCVPLPVRMRPGDSDPVYGVICIGSTNTSTSLRQLIPGTERWYTILDVIQGKGINGKIRGLLTGE
jgi:hypothetical protein